MHLVAFERRVRLTVAIVKRQRRWRRGERFLHDRARERDPLGLAVARESCGDESVESFVVLNENTGLFENGQSFIHDALDERAFEDLHPRSQGTRRFLSGSKKGSGTTFAAARRCTYSTVYSRSSEVPGVS